MPTWIPQRPATGHTLIEQQSTPALALGQMAPVAFSALGRAGLLVAVSSNVPTWLSLYSSTAARDADGERLITADPTADSGVLLDLALEAGRELLLPPGCTYLNAETPPASVLYGQVRRASGESTALVVTIQIRALVLAL